MVSPRRSEASFRKSFAHSVNAALEGVVHTLMHERNMRIHFLAGFLVILAGIYFNLAGVELLVLLFAVTFVLAAEMFNTALEYMVDLVNDEYHPLAKIIKDISAGAVFVSALNALFTGYILFTKSVSFSFSQATEKIRQSPWHITLITLIFVTGLVLLIKVLRHEKVLLRGGMPSGHSALSFAIWMLVTLLSENAIVSILVLMMAVHIARTRIAHGIHTVWEIVAGSLLGAVTALLIYQLFVLLPG
jgi:diacylglycerol kinase (ATP)